MSWGTNWLLLKQNSLIRKQNELLDQKKKEAEEARQKRIAFFGKEEVLKMEVRERLRAQGLENMSETEAGIRILFILGFIALCLYYAVQ
tara:strand:+ start:623 stop:889 length:267 start_codon:yes stop_codon:yes gene_type:complete